MQLETKSTWFFVCYLLATQNSKKQNNETKTQRKHNNNKKNEKHKIETINRIQNYVMYTKHCCCTNHHCWTIG